MGKEHDRSMIGWMVLKPLSFVPVIVIAHYKVHPFIIAGYIDG